MCKEGNACGACWAECRDDVPGNCNSIVSRVDKGKSLRNDGYAEDGAAWKRHRNDALRERLDMDHYVAFSTCAYANSEPVMASRTFPFLLVDEAAQAAEPELAAPHQRE